MNGMPENISPAAAPGGRPRAPWPGRAVLVLLLFVLPFAVFSRVVFFDFINYDDVEVLVDNPQAHGLSAPNVKRALTYFFVEAYYPVRLLSLALDYELWGGADPMGFHLTNLILHLANAWLLFLLVLSSARLAGHDALTSRRTALAGAALFAVHPAAVEPVGWIMGREELLMLFFYLSCLLLHTRAVRSGNKSFLLHVLAAYAALFSGLSHATAMTLPVAAALHHVAVAGERDWKRLLARTSYLWAIAGVVVLLRFLTLATYDEATQSLLFPRVADALARLPDLAGHYRMVVQAATSTPDSGILHALFKVILLSGDAVFPFFLPTGQAPDEAGLAHPARLIQSAAVISFFGIVLWRPGNRRLLALGLLWFLAALYPDASWRIGLLLPSRVFYLPVAALSVAGGALAVRAAGGRRAGLAAFLAVVALYAAMSTVRLSAFQDSLTFHTKVVREFPDFWKAHLGLGMQYLRLSLYEEAAAEYEKAARLDPDQDEPWIRLVKLAMDQGWKDRALPWARVMARTGPASADRRALLGMALDMAGHKEEAFGEIMKALALKPEHPAILNAYGVALMDRGETRGAIPLFLKALARYPHMAQVEANLALALEQTGRPEEAREHYLRAREIAQRGLPPGGRIMLMPLWAARGPVRATANGKGP